MRKINRNLLCRQNRQLPSSVSPWQNKPPNQLLQKALNSVLSGQGRRILNLGSLRLKFLSGITIVRILFSALERLFLKSCLFSGRVISFLPFHISLDLLIVRIASPLVILLKYCHSFPVTRSHSFHPGILKSHRQSRRSTKNASIYLTPHLCIIIQQKLLYCLIFTAKT